jgi:hypothetical protein
MEEALKQAMVVPGVEEVGEKTVEEQKKVVAQVTSSLANMVL